MPAATSEFNTDCPGCRELPVQLAAAQERIGELEAPVTTQQERIAQLEGASRRQAVPFRRPQHKCQASNKKPGRKPGHRPEWRQAPPTVNEFTEVPLEKCPHCGGPVEDVRPLEQIIEDIPPVVVVRRRLIIYRGRYARCGTVRSTHREQVSSAWLWVFTNPQLTL